MVGVGLVVACPVSDYALLIYWTRWASGTVCCELSRAATTGFATHDYNLGALLAEMILDSARGDIVHRWVVDLEYLDNLLGTAIDPLDTVGVYGTYSPPAPSGCAAQSTCLGPRQPKPELQFKPGDTSGRTTAVHD